MLATQPEKCMSSENITLQSSLKHGPLSLSGLDMTISAEKEVPITFDRFSAAPTQTLV